MNPKPLAVLKNFTVPIVIRLLLRASVSARAHAHACERRNHQVGKLGCLARRATSTSRVSNSCASSDGRRRNPYINQFAQLFKEEKPIYQWSDNIQPWPGPI